MGLDANPVHIPGVLNCLPGYVFSDPVLRGCFIGLIDSDWIGCTNYDDDAVLP